jgi:hypothetical protein
MVLAFSGGQRVWSGELDRTHIAKYLILPPTMTRDGIIHHDTRRFRLEHLFSDMAMYYEVVEP